MSDHTDIMTNPAETPIDPETARLWEAMEALQKKLTNRDKWIEQFEDALQKKANVNAVGYEWRTPLTYLLHHKMDLAYLRELLRYGARPDRADECSELPLQVLLRNENEYWIPIVSLLAKYDADLNQTWKDESGANSLRERIWRSLPDAAPEQEIIDRWLEKGFTFADADGRIDSHHFRYSYCFAYDNAIQGLSKETVNALADFLCRNGLIHAIDGNGYKFHQYHLCTLPLDMAEAFLKGGADATEHDESAAKPDTGHHPVFFNLSGGLPLLRLFMENTVNLSALASYGGNLFHQLIFTGNKDAIQMIPLLVEAGVDINHAADNGETPLQAAIRLDRDAELIKALLDHGARARIEQHLHSNLSPQHVKLLIDHGADAMVAVDSGMNLLRFKLQQKIIKFGKYAEIFIAAGVPIFRKDADGGSLYHDILSLEESLDLAAHKDALTMILFPFCRLQERLKQPEALPVEELLDEQGKPTYKLMQYVSFGLLPEMLDGRRYVGNSDEAKRILKALPKHLTTIIDTVPFEERVIFTNAIKPNPRTPLRTPTR